MHTRITPFLSFDTEAEEAVHFYTSLFKNSEIRTILRYGDAGPGPKGGVMAIIFTLDGQEFYALNGGPHSSFGPSLSLFIHCDTQEEIDHLWEGLSAGGQPIQCGWVRDKYGITWQVVPRMMWELLNDPDPVRSQNVMRAMMGMVKLDIAALQRAHAS